MPAQIFVSYSSLDCERVRPLVEQLQSLGWTVWWDLRIEGGESFAATIERALAEAAVVVVVWTEHARVSNWVLDEAQEGRKRSILVPVRLSALEAPLGFRQIQTIDLSNWSGDVNEANFRSFLRAVEKIAGPAPQAPTDQVPVEPPSHRRRWTLRRYAQALAGVVGLVALATLLLPQGPRKETLTEATIEDLSPPSAPGPPAATADLTTVQSVAPSSVRVAELLEEALAASRRLDWETADHLASQALTVEPGSSGAMALVALATKERRNQKRFKAYAASLRLNDCRALRLAEDIPADSAYRAQVENTLPALRRDCSRPDTTYVPPQGAPLTPQEECERAHGQWKLVGGKWACE